LRSKFKKSIDDPTTLGEMEEALVKLGYAKARK